MACAQYDILVVGAGLFGGVIARKALDEGKSVLVVEKRNHIGGNCYSRKESGIDVHVYGPHVIHTDHKVVWEFFTKYVDVETSLSSPIAKRREKLYHLPFNMDTYYALWGVTTPSEAQEVIQSQIVKNDTPTNLEEYALAKVGKDIFETLVKEYVEKQYGKPCRQLPVSLLGRMPIRLTFDNDYLGHRYQGVPTDGYEGLFAALFEGADVRLGTDYLENRSELDLLAESIVYTGSIDSYFDYRFGPLEYRGRRFEEIDYPTESKQGISVITYPDASVPYLRSIEHKHFLKSPRKMNWTILSYEYATEWKVGDDPYYAIDDENNRARYEQYLQLSKQYPNVHFGGRLGEYRYYDMSDTILSALEKYAAWYSNRG